MYERQRHLVTGWLGGLVRVVLPAPCLACRSREAHSPLGLCRVCYGRLEGARDTVCTSCARPLPSVPTPSDGRCGDCRRHPPPFVRLLSLWRYQTPFDAVIRGLKFQRLEYLGAALAAALLDGLGREVLKQHHAVVPVPLHPWRRWRRGYNQAEAIAKPLAKGVGLPVWHVLGRPRATPPQSGLSLAERQVNVARAFRCRRRFRGRCSGQRLLLVDDVVTTGATLRAAATPLKRAGATVTALAAARTPEPFA